MTKVVLLFGGAAVENRAADEAVGARIECLELDLGVALVARRHLQVAQRRGHSAAAAGRNSSATSTEAAGV